MTDLELATTDDLIAELFRRHTAVVIVRVFPVKTTDTQEDTLIDYCGGINTAIGLSERARAMLVNDVVKRHGRPEDPE